MEEQRVKATHALGNSLLHEHWMKLVDSSLTMMLQKMEQVLVSLGTPGSKHKLTY